VGEKKEVKKRSEIKRKKLHQQDKVYVFLVLGSSMQKE
jgi:hypothetical protein